VTIDILYGKRFAGDIAQTRGRRRFSVSPAKRFAQGHPGACPARIRQCQVGKSTTMCRSSYLLLWLVSCVPRHCSFPHGRARPRSPISLCITQEVGATFPRATCIWLTYKRNGLLAGVAILSVDSLMGARMHASANRISKGALFEQGHMLDAQIASNCRGVWSAVLERREAVELLAQIERGIGDVRRDRLGGRGRRSVCSHGNYAPGVIFPDGWILRSTNKKKA
jgi:hypothetical protein